MMIQPTRVLPSNASPLRDADSLHGPRVLQEHSGNRQYHNYSYTEHSQPKYPPSLSTENSYIGHQPLHHEAHYYQQHPAQRYHGGSRRSRPPTREEQDAWMRKCLKEADVLYARFRASDGYAKYRQRQQREEKPGTEQKWPEHLEVAFFQALAIFPPMGRNKQSHRDKLRGRNELISDYIYQETRVLRTRKQVSSHIQVLKPFTRGDPAITKYFVKQRGHGDHYGGSRSSHVDRRHTSRYPVNAPPHDMCNGRFPMPRVDTRDWSSSHIPLGTFEPLSFEMFVQQKFVQDHDKPDIVKRLHTYTASTHHPCLADEHFRDWPTLGYTYPQLAKMHARRPLNCNLVAAQASIALTTDTWKDQENVELGISFSCRGQQLPAGAAVTCLNRFYKDGICFSDSGVPDDVVLHETEHGQVEAQVKFGSQFWASSLASLANRLRHGTDPMTGISNTREEVRRLVDGITATQEIVAHTDHGAETLLVIFWKFRLSSGVQGQASWHRLQLSSTPGVHCDEYSQDHTLDSFASTLPYDDPSNSHHVHPALQSPFEYDQDSSSGGSALTSATWPISFSDTLETAPPSAVDFSTDNSLDFTGGNINVSYGDTNFDFSNFDSSAFNLDATTSFVTESMIDPFSQHDYSTQYCDSYAPSYDTSQPISAGDASFAMTAIDSLSQNVFEGFGEPYNQDAHDAQAYGGAGQDVIKEEDPLAALADASYMVSGVLTQEDRQTHECVERLRE
ncbi:Tec1-like protein [Zymoseptoria tritici IPO323]|uniref:Tec1-like protein n=1 Tax=Zymoseptoria tritici (strain CBS 115943 / IPO323) TaxID=336722 RepID=F9X894_ZYMTI|nr:Tec1-like protein [Zymoseptoria tritici IPO323]EGP87880.1 Tec1-like protein [Zymoseptoria tritici IPO323]